MRLPRFLWVPFELGRPFGAPHEPDFQRGVLHDALALVERTDGPIVLADFPDDAPSGDHETVWACPISFAAPETDEPDLVSATRAELRQLAPWAEVAPAPIANSGLDHDAMIDLLAVAAEGKASALEDIRLAADVLRTCTCTRWLNNPVVPAAPIATPGYGERQRSHTCWAASLPVCSTTPTRRCGCSPRHLVPRDHFELLVRPNQNGATDA